VDYVRSSETSVLTKASRHHMPENVIFNHKHCRDCVKFDVFTAVTMKNAVFWNVTSCGSCRNDVSEEHIASIIRVRKMDELGTTLAVTNNRSTLRYVPPKRWFLQEPHGDISQKKAFFKRVLIGFYVFKAVTMKHAVFWNMTTPCSSCENRRFGGT
jgi:hypothetical protein